MHEISTEILPMVLLYIVTTHSGYFYIVAARVGFEPATLRTESIELTTEPPRSTSVRSDSHRIRCRPNWN